MTGTAQQTTQPLSSGGSRGKSGILLLNPSDTFDRSVSEAAAPLTEGLTLTGDKEVSSMFVITSLHYTVIISVDLITNLLSPGLLFAPCTAACVSCWMEAMLRRMAYCGLGVGFRWVKSPKLGASTSLKWNSQNIYIEVEALR